MRISSLPFPFATLLRPGSLVVPLLLVPLAGGCGEGSSDKTSPAAPVVDAAAIAPASREVQREIRDLMTAMTPLPATAGKAEQSAWFPQRRQILERLRAGGPEVGREALRVYLDRPDALEKVRVGLLDVAAHGVPELVRPILVSLITTFSEEAELRKEACAILARTSPAKAAEVLGAILSEDRPRVTYPPMDAILGAWIEAMDTLGEDQAGLLSRVATDLLKATAVRTTALRALGKRDSVIGRQALETVVIESSGDHYLRRIAVQSLLATLPREVFCDFIRDVMSKEADTGFQLFLADNLDKYCQ